MIRESKAEDISAILTLWMESTIHAHPFIEERYWRESESVVRDVYLPAAQTWVWEEEGELKGFVSVIDDRFLGALFVAVGVDTTLLARGAEALAARFIEQPVTSVNNNKSVY